MSWLSGQATIARSRGTEKQSSSHGGLDEDTGVDGVVVVTAEVAAPATPPSSRPRQQGLGSTVVTERSSPGHYHHITTSPAPLDLVTVTVRLSRNSGGGGSQRGNRGRRRRRARARRRAKSTRRHGRAREKMGQVKRGGLVEKLEED
jgi:hypothetical protein